MSQWTPVSPIAIEFIVGILVSAITVFRLVDNILSSSLHSVRNIVHWPIYTLDLRVNSNRDTGTGVPCKVACKLQATKFDGDSVWLRYHTSPALDTHQFEGLRADPRAGNPPHPQPEAEARQGVWAELLAGLYSLILSTRRTSSVGNPHPVRVRLGRTDVFPPCLALPYQMAGLCPVLLFQGHAQCVIRLSIQIKGAYTVTLTEKRARAVFE